MKTLIATVTYNEIGNIEEFCQSVLALDPKFHLLVVDDNSPDGTGRLLDKLARKNSRLKIIHRPGKLGIASAHMATFLYAIQKRYNTLVTMDADLSHDPKEIPKLLRALTDDSFVLGSRFTKGGSCDYTGMRKLLSLAGNLSSRFLLGIPFKETTTSFRAFPVETLRKINLGRMSASGYSFFFELVFRLLAIGAQGKEVPIHFGDRYKGKSKIPRGEVFKSLFKLTMLFFFRVLGKTDLSPTGIIEQKECYFCDSTLLIERLARRGSEALTEEDFRCTSMEHYNKPQVLECLACGLRFASHEPNIEKQYEDVKDERYVDGQHARELTFRKVWSQIEPFLPNRGKLLEVGSYCGYFLSLAKERGFEVQGVEPSKWAAGVCRKEFGIKVAEGTLNDTHKKLGKSFDGVVLWDVMEHFDDPITSLNQINTLLRNDGWLCFSTLDVSNWFPRLLRSNWPWYMVMHRFYFSQYNLRRFLESTGFEVRHVERYHHYVSLNYLARKLLSLARLDGSLFGKLLLKLIPSIIYVPISFGDIKLYVCQKTRSVQKRLPKSEPAPRRAA